MNLSKVALSFVVAALALLGHVNAAYGRDGITTVLRLIEGGAKSFGKSAESQGKQASGADAGQGDAEAGPIGFDRCPQLFPEGKPLDTTRFDKRWQVVELCSNHFAVVYSKLTKSPLLVIEKLNRDMLASARDEARTDVFYPDPRLKRGERAELSDFAGSGRDRGHMANAADQPDRGSMIQSFALSNMVLQDPVNNREGAWLKAEKDTRRYVKRAKGNVWVFSGPLFKGEVRKFGRNQVWEPTHLFKLVYDVSQNREWAHVMTNTADARLKEPLGYREFVEQTGMDVLRR